MCQKNKRHLKGIRSNKSNMLHFKRATTNCISFILILSQRKRDHCLDVKSLIIAVYRYIYCSYRKSLKAQPVKGNLSLSQPIKVI
jgi:hypothetical protein